MTGDPTKGCSSDSKLVESDTAWSGWDSCWTMFGESGLSSGCCCWGLSKITSSEAISEAFCEFAT